MQKILTDKLYEYIRENQPDLLLQLEQEGKVTDYLLSKINSVSDLADTLTEHPTYIIEEACMNFLIEDLPPSKFDYINNILQQDFAGNYERLEGIGILRFEIINLINFCQDTFNAFGFDQESEHNIQLMYAITGSISEYLESNNK